MTNKDKAAKSSDDEVHADTNANPEAEQTPARIDELPDVNTESALSMIGMEGGGSAKVAKTDALGNQELAVVDPIAMAMAAQMGEQVKARYAIAQMRPRDEDQARMKIERECRRPAFAEVARYDLERHSRGSGPSARFAELAARCWGNIDAGSYILAEDESSRRLYCYCTDLQTNWTEHEMLVIARTVERNPNRVRGRTVLQIREKPGGGEVAIVRATDEEMDSKTKNFVSRTLRVLRLRHIPGDFIETCMAIVVATQRDEQARDPDAFRKSLLRSFMVMSVTPEDLAEYLGKPFAKASPKEMAELQSVGRRARDDVDYTWEAALAAKLDLRGEGTPSDTANKSGPVGAALSQRRAETARKAEPKGKADADGS